MTSFWKSYEANEHHLCKQFQQVLTDNPISSLIDLEDPEYVNTPIVLDRYVTQNGHEYIEFDQRLRLCSDKL